MWSKFLSPKQGVVMFMYDVSIIIGTVGVIIGVLSGHKGWYLLALAVAPLLWILTAMALLVLGFIGLAVVMISMGWVSSWHMTQGRYEQAERLEDIMYMLELGSRKLLSKL